MVNLTGYSDNEKQQSLLLSPEIYLEDNEKDPAFLNNIADSRSAVVAVQSIFPDEITDAALVTEEASTSFPQEVSFGETVLINAEEETETKDTHASFRSVSQEIDNPTPAPEQHTPERPVAEIVDIATLEKTTRPTIEESSVAVEEVEGHDDDDHDHDHGGDLAYMDDAEGAELYAEYMADFTSNAATTSFSTGNATLDGLLNLRSITDIISDFGGVMNLSSNPGAKVTMLLDFDGYEYQPLFGDYISANSYRNWNMNSLTESGQAEIYSIWLKVSEAFSMFDVNVTTKDPMNDDAFGPAFFSPVTRDKDTLDTLGGRMVMTQNFTSKSSGGYAYIHSFASLEPGFAFNKGKNAGATATHEFGHMLGLGHDGTTSEQYYWGHGSGATKWSPFMGAAFTQLTQWDNGSYNNASNKQDDLAVMESKYLTMVADDHSNEFSGATYISTGDNEVFGYGNISTRTDTDVFQFTTGDGAVSIKIDGAKGGIYYNLSSLDILAKLYNSAGLVIATSNPIDQLNASFDLELAAGDYYIRIDGTGLSEGKGYTDYGSLGHFLISGTTAPTGTDTGGDKNTAPINLVDNNSDADTVAENAPVGTVVGITAKATDPEGDALTYSLVDNAGGKFAINTATGVVTVASTLDYETATSHNITVRATDAGGLTVDKTFTVNVSNVNEAPFNLTDTNSTTNSVAENAAIGTVVGITAKATDPENGTLTYSLVDNASGKFAINTATGVVTVASTLDYETATSHNITVRATDAGGLAINKTFTVNVSNVNETPFNLTDINSAANSVAENAAIGTVVGITAKATDPENGALTYSLLDNAGGKFAVNASTGVVSVASALNHAVAPSHTITVRATDAGGLSVDKTFSINVTNVNKAPLNLVDTNTAANNIAENAVIGTVVGITAQATDPENGVLTYSLMDNAGGKFAINAATGVVTVAGKLDYETATSHNITVRATDAGGLTLDKVFTVNVTDINESVNRAPLKIADINGAPQRVSENSEIGTTVGITAHSIDPDGDKVTYSMVDDAGGLFTINATTGVVTVASDIDYEAINNLQRIIVRATDTDGLSVDKGFTISIANVNEFPVGLKDVNTATNSVNKTATAGTAVGITAKATDPEGSSITYSLANSDGGIFAIDSSTGVVTIANAAKLNAASAGDHIITVRAADGGARAITKDFVIKVNGDDQGPIITSDVAFSIAEAAKQVGQITATDTISKVLSYSITGGDDAALFSINKQTGMLSFKKSPDFEAPKDANGDNHYSVMVSVSDGMHTTSEEITIAVTNVNEAPLKIVDNDANPQRVSEHAEIGTTVGITAHTTDPDGDTVIYSMVDDAGGLFTVDAVTGVVTAASDIDYESIDNFQRIVVRATDTGGLFTDKSFTISIADVNEFPVGLKDINLAENKIDVDAIKGAAVGITAHASDPEGSSIVYKLLNGSGMFTIDSNTGVVTVADADLLKASTANEHVVTIGAADGGARTTTADFVIKVDGVETPVSTDGDDDDNNGSTGNGGGQGNVDVVIVRGSNDLGSILIGGNGNDLLAGNGGADHILGMGGLDTVLGNDGNDTLNGNAGSDMVNGNAGNDIVYGGQDDDEVHGGQGNDSVNGNKGNDSVFGDLGDDVVRGGQGFDTLYGGEGNDSLHGDKGNDVMTGGEGSDYFYFMTGHGDDVVTDFTSGSDVLAFSSQLFATAEEAVAAFSDGVIVASSSSVVLTGVTSLSASDIMII